MKRILAVLALFSSIATATAAEHTSITVAEPFDSAARTISKQMERCYVESGMLVGGFHVWDDIDYDARTGEVLYQISGLAGKKTAVTVTLEGQEESTLVTVTSGGMLYNSTARRIQGQIERWVAGDKSC